MNTSARVSTVSTAAGPFTVVVDPDLPVVLASGWTAEPADLVSVIHPTLRPVSLTGVDRIYGVTDAVIAYHDGDLGAVDAVEVRQTSGDFLVHAWSVLRSVPAGSPVTYTEFAALSGRPAAVRGAASACARNAAALFVPCHRVLRTDGSLGGFRWGLPAKRWLLDHESAALSSAVR